MSAAAKGSSTGPLYMQAELVELIICSIFPGIHNSVRAMSYHLNILDKQPLPVHKLPVCCMSSQFSDPRPTGYTMGDFLQSRTQ